MFNSKKQLALELFHEYLAVCDQLYAAKEKQGMGDPEEISNALEKKWEEWQFVTNSINDFLLKGVAFHHKKISQKNL